ncbi:hypothetical protein EDC04DRAFT_2603189 [Pisolithus marmoratus]|nr:hypothetical protein EDC04DRAFT_2603189 [Pisolithus marmoratus]
MVMFLYQNQESPFPESFPYFSGAISMHYSAGIICHYHACNFVGTMEIRGLALNTAATFTTVDMDEPEQPYSDMYDGPIHPLRLPRGQDTSLMEWVPYREIYLSVLHDMEAPPNPRRGGQEHSLRTTPLDCLQYLKVGFIMHLGHGGKPCPHSGYPGCNISPSMEDEWEDMDTAGHPPHLARPEGHSCLTIVNVNGVHYCNVWYCNCNGAKGSQLQLLRAGLFPVTMRDCRTSCTLHVLDDFLQDNVECGTSAMNYYSKIWGMTSRTFPHLVLPRINIPGMDGVELSHWKYSHVIVMDGNFKAEHMAPKNAGNETWLMDGQGYMVASQDYKTYLGGTTNKIMHSNCNNHCTISQANHNRVVDFQKGKQELEYSHELVSGMCMVTRQSVSQDMLPILYPVLGMQMEVLDIQMNDSNILKMIRMHESNNYIQATCQTKPTIAGALQKKYKAAQKCDVAVEEAFTSLNNTLPNELQEKWEQEEQATFAKRTDDPRTMDIFDVQLQKVPTIKSIEIDLISAPKLARHPWGSATWIACRLSIEEAQVSLALNYSKGLDYQLDPDALEAMELPLPSYLGAAKCQELGLDILQQEELQLQQGQVNDALHQLRLALADKSQLYCQDV